MINTQKGAKVRFGGEEMKVICARGFDSLTLQSSTGEYFDAPLSDLENEASGTPKANVIVDTIRQAKVPAYVKALGPLLERDRLTRAEVSRAGEMLGISTSSAYAAIARFRQSGSTDELPPPTRPGGRGKPRILPKVEAIIQKVLEETLLNRRNLKPRTFYKRAKTQLEKAGFQVSQGTLRDRVANIPEHKWNKARKGYNEARRTDHPIAGSYPEVQKPLDVIQIDHWKADIEILSDDRLTVIGRVWITLAIDIYSRMVFGMHVAIDAPSTTTLGLAMINGMLRKDIVAAKYGLEWNNPIYGPIGRLEADNAGEFTGKSIKATANHFHFRLKWRPLGAPQYGGHIERLNATLAERFKELPGATGSTPNERKAFRPEMTAAFTLEDLIRHVWLLIDEYHNQVHTGIGVTPLEKFTSYYFGPNGQKHRLPPLYVDSLEFRRHWYPLETRSLQRYGIRIDHLDYYSENISLLVKNRKKGERLQIRRNPFDVREIYVFHPSLKEWVTVATRHLGFPVASIFELQQARKEALKRKRKPTPEVLAKIIDEQHRHIEEAKQKTKTAQRDAARRAHHNRTRQEPGATSRSAGSTPNIEIVNKPRSGDAVTSETRRTPPIHVSAPQVDLSSILADISDDDIEELFE
ncbi:MAG: Mu transposase C-terminal domain-containing protein [Sphingomonas sp.]